MLSAGRGGVSPSGELLVDGAITRRTTGRKGDQLSRREWDISKWRGKRAILGIVDNSTEAWGYLALDEIVQWRR